MLAVIRESEVSQVSDELESVFEILPSKSFPVNWSHFRDIFQEFLETEYEQLIVIWEIDAIDLHHTTNLESFKFFDCFDVTAQRIRPSALIRKFKYSIKLLLPSTPLKSLNQLMRSQFLKRIIYTNARAKAISFIAKEISAGKQIRTNWLSPKPAGIIFSRKAASTLIEFNHHDLISSERVLRSVLRSSNLSFGSFL